MPLPKLLLCTDLDRTLLPNGEALEHPSARPLFRKLCTRPEVTLAYVSGRHLQLIEDAISEYQLPRPDYVISDVGTKIYQSIDHQWQKLTAWEKQIATAWRDDGTDHLHRILGKHPALTLQTSEKQTNVKLSYNVSLDGDDKTLLAWVKQQLAQSDLATNLIWSIDEQANKGLLDILPANADKLHAINFLQQQLDEPDQSTIFAGDSGNDLTVLISTIPAIIVANANSEVKQRALQLVTKNNLSATLFLATAQHNYSAGIVQGVAHFIPEYADWLNAAGGLP